MVVGDFETINSTTCSLFLMICLLPNFPFDHAALHGAGRSLWPTAAPKKDHPGQRSPLLKLLKTKQNMFEGRYVGVSCLDIQTYIYCIYGN